VVTKTLSRVLISAALLATLWINVYTLRQIPRAATRVPWWDEWVTVDEFAAHEHGRPLWPILWSPYWGHRLVIPRLIFFADLRWTARAPLTWLTLAVQSAHLALLLRLAWVLLGRVSLTRFAVAGIVVLNLMLSPYQMENFTWSMQTMFPLVYTAATISFYCLARSRDGGRGVYLPLSVAAGWLSSWTMPNGLLVWPVLVAEAIYLKLRRRTVVLLACIGAAMMVFYGWHYENRALGMGFGPMLRRPLIAMRLLGLLLSGSLSYLSKPLGQAVALLAIASAGYLTVRVLRRRDPEQQYAAVLAAAVLFLFLSAAAMVAGRFTREWLRTDLSLPSKYFTLVGTFWAGVGLLVLYATARQQARLIRLGLWGVFFFCLMFANPRRQFVAADDWADFFRGADAVGAAFLLNAPDEQLLSILWPSKAERDERVEFLRQRHAAFFAEPRATWPGGQIAELFPPVDAGHCIGGIERVTGWRVEGWAWDTQASRPPDDVLITDPAGRITGLARGGFRHGYFPGFFTDPQPARVPHTRLYRSEWLGYAQPADRRQWTLYAVRGGGRVCRIEQAVP